MNGEDLPVEKTFGGSGNILTQNKSIHFSENISYQFN